MSKGIDIMKTILTLLMILILSGTVLAGDGYKHSELYDFELSNPQQLYKSESFGRNLAIFPGIFFHGVGHMYSGHGAEGFLLLLSELTGLVLIIGDHLDGTNFQYAPPPNPPESDPPPEYPPMNYGPGSNEGDTGILTYIGGALFVGSWIYDCVKTPLLVREYNNKIDHKYEALSLSLKPDLKSSTIMLNLSFNF